MLTANDDQSMPTAAYEKPKPTQSTSNEGEGCVVIGLLVLFAVTNVFWLLAYKFAASDHRDLLIKRGVAAYDETTGEFYIKPEGQAEVTTDD